MRITEKMIKFHQNNKNQQNLVVIEDNEPLTEISRNNHNTKSDKPSHISIRHDNVEEEEEKKITEHSENNENPDKNSNMPPEDNYDNNNREEEKNDNHTDHKKIIEQWKQLKKSFLLNNIFAVIQYMNIKLEGIVEKQISKEVFIFKYFYKK